MKRHQLDLFSLVAGVSFVAVAVFYLFDSIGRLHVDARLVVPLLLIALGVGGLAGALYRMARGSAASEPPDSASDR
ncbi:hypothetical protein [Streptacidiphilus sp. EB129]|uniref:hypothetical protein n=1 Tax=Streptacidiphilus sp. EB129 TaxID=3156262 RepID=UPI003511FD42